METEYLETPLSTPMSHAPSLSNDAEEQEPKIDTCVGVPLGLWSHIFYIGAVASFTVYLTLWIVGTFFPPLLFVLVFFITALQWINSIRESPRLYMRAFIPIFAGFTLVCLLISIIITAFIALDQRHINALQSATIGVLWTVAFLFGCMLHRVIAFSLEWQLA